MIVSMDFLVKRTTLVRKASILLVIGGLMLPAASAMAVFPMAVSAESNAAERSDERPCDERPCDERDTESEAEIAIRCVRQRMGRLQGAIVTIGRSACGFSPTAGTVGRHSIGLGHETGHRLRGGALAPLRL